MSAALTPDEAAVKRLWGLAMDYAGALMALDQAPRRPAPRSAGAKGQAEFAGRLDIIFGDAVEAFEAEAQRLCALGHRDAPVAAPVLPGVTRLRKQIAEYDAAAGAEAHSYARAQALWATEHDREGHRAALDTFRVAEKRLAKFTSLDAPAILDAVDGTAPTFLERHAATLEARRVRDELAVAKAERDAARRVVKDLVSGGCIAPPVSAELMDRLTAIVEGE